MIIEILIPIANLRFLNVQLDKIIKNIFSKSHPDSPFLNLVSTKKKYFSVIRIFTCNTYTT